MYQILRFKKYYLIKNTEGGYENHTHIKIKSRTGEKEYITCKKLVHILNNKQIPLGGYLLSSAIRLTTDPEYKAHLKRIKKRRQKRYYNSLYKRIRRY